MGRLSGARQEASFAFHAFRHLGASLLDDQHKVSTKKLQTLLRHKEQRTTEIYLHNLDNDPHDVVNLFGLEVEKLACKSAFKNGSKGAKIARNVTGQNRKISNN